MQTMFPIIPDMHVTGLILAGGKAKRLGGEDKGLIQLGQRHLIEHVIDRLQPQTTSVLINANRNQETYRGFGYPVIADGVPDFAGPLAGILAGLQHMTTEWLVVVPCDNPALPNKLVMSLAEVTNQQQCLLTVANCQGNIQPVFCLLHKSLADSISDFLAKDQHRVQDWLVHQTYSVCEFDDPNAFSNINTPEQLQEASKTP
ncbi:MAG: molybdenum cofactor guanylyltransferase [Gammaproteobacteria bacterium]|nr:molybdenum cofactor guanylyltransferase [Gammaproteobacteria bacterium]